MRYTVLRFPSYLGSPVNFHHYWQARFYALRVQWYNFLTCQFQELRIVDNINGKHIVL